MKWTLEKDFAFEAAHILPHHDGKCSRLHGHSYKCTVYVQSDRLISEGSESAMVMDFSRLKAAMKPLLEKHLDHYFLNESLEMESATAEAIAQWIYRRLKESGIDVCAVKLAETCTCSVTYTEEV